MLKGCDFDTHLTDELAAALVAEKYSAIGRYGKNLTADEVDLCRQYGLGLWLISEVGDGGPDRLTSSNGISDATAIVRQAQALGFPEGSTLFAAAFDFDALEAHIPQGRAYMTGFMLTVHAAKYKGQMYADGLMQENIETDGGGYIPGSRSFANSADYIIGGKAALVQHPTTTVAGVEIDPVDILDESVIWYPQGAPAQAAPQQAADASAAPAEATNAPLPKLSALQAGLQSAGYDIAADGIFGPQTASALAQYYGQNPG